MSNAPAVQVPGSSAPPASVRVCAIVPARDEEANIADAVASLDLQLELAQIIVVDDQSSDSTPAILAGLAARVPRLKTLKTPTLPPGWAGKNHAAALGASLALKTAALEGGAGEMGAQKQDALENSWLLFTDADTRHLPGSLAAALRIAREREAALVSVSPRQIMASFWERALIPVVYCRLAHRFPFDRVNNPRLPDAAANGQYLLIRADAYEAIGGHAAIRACILEDVELARRAKSASYRIWFQSGETLVETRMYQSLSALKEGWTKNLSLLLGGGFTRMIREVSPCWIVELSIATLILGCIIWRRGLPGGEMSAALGLLALLLIHARYAIELRRNRYPLHLIQYYVPGVLLFGKIFIDSWWRNKFGAVEWKGRTYPAGMR